MGGAPVIVEPRPGVQLSPAAAESLLRLEADLGFECNINSSYRDWDKQLRMYYAWEAYANGTGPYPGHSRAIHPLFSVHCQGNAMDVANWRAIVAKARRHGWVQTLPNDPTERHHFEYRFWLDEFYGQGAPDKTEEETQEEIDMLLEIWSCPAWDAAGEKVVTNGENTDTMNAGWLQTLYDNKAARWVNFRTNDDMLFALRVVWHLKGLSDNVIKNALVEIANKARIDIADDIQAALDRPLVGS